MMRGRHEVALEGEPVTSRDMLAWTLYAEAQALLTAASKVDHDRFAAAVFTIVGRPSIAITGIGKSLCEAHRLASMFRSSGMVSHVFDPVQAMHGEIGGLANGSTLLALSHSGESLETIKLVELVTKTLVRVARTIAITSSLDSTLARLADIVLTYGAVHEACPLGLMPSASTAVMGAIGDALVFAVARERGFTKEKFADIHPAGSLGKGVACCADGGEDEDDE